MDVLDATAVLGAGIAAGGINAIVGSGSLITFPTLLALGYPPVIANVSNNLGLVTGNIGGAYGYREELRDQGRRVVRLGVASVAGAVAGGLLLLTLPPEAFAVIVPVLILVALVLVVAQPRIQAWMRERRDGRGRHRPDGGPLLWLGVLGSGMYGGYFGAAQGIVLISLLGIGLDDDLQRLNGLKNALVSFVNGAAAVLFIVMWLLGETDIAWWAVLMVAVGSTIGGVLGARLARRIPPLLLRTVIVAVGVAAIVELLSE